MHLHERSLSVLACRYVDDVIIGAPWEISKDMITTFNISLVGHGTVSEVNYTPDAVVDPYKVPKSMGIFRTLESPKNITTTFVAERIKANHEIYQVLAMDIYNRYKKNISCILEKRDRADPKGSKSEEYDDDNNKNNVLLMGQRAQAIVAGRTEKGPSYMDVC
ncbi:hypothetical protein M8C21_002173 [Ambrosia artemisiifolia]|uniref:Uncharacterized protein n=1 Tax=Ambrosia artemisiifolia TaxID=4212 RepID=A0AAD5BTB6_AMBAR|nr:hypothetical protein M8C21_002173 [Ambrosia artemisiifolia]